MTFDSRDNSQDCPSCCCRCISQRHLHETQAAFDQCSGTTQILEDPREVWPASTCNDTHARTAMKVSGIRAAAPGSDHLKIECPARLALSNTAG